MKPNALFTSQPKHFWAYVRSISEQTGYTETRKGPNKGQVKIPDITAIKDTLIKIDLDTSEIVNRHGKPTAFGATLQEYFVHRANELNNFTQSYLMNVARAKNEFENLFKKLSPQAPIPMNKQRGDKKAPAYFTGIINMIIEDAIKDLACDYDPQQLITITKDHKPLYTLSRRVDGAFPSPINPIAIWEIKEYYYTTTFGSRVADGVYETLLDGMELQEAYNNHGIKVLHYMMVDAYETWWTKGRSYLCRMVDMLHMNYVDEILFGYEVIEKLPSIAKQWVEIARQRNKK